MGADDWGPVVGAARPATAPVAQTCLLLDDDEAEVARLAAARERVRARREACRELPATPRDPPPAGAGPPEALMLLSELVDDADDFVRCIDRSRVVVVPFNPEEDAAAALVARVCRARREHPLGSFETVAVVTHGDRDNDDEEGGADSFRWLLTQDLPIIIPGEGEAALSPRSAAAAFARRHPALGRLAAALAVAARRRVDLFGCGLYGDRYGRALIDMLSTEAGMPFAASDDDTGNLAAGGDWVLESAGVDVCAVYFDAARVADYRAVFRTGSAPPAGRKGGGKVPAPRRKQGGGYSGAGRKGKPPAPMPAAGSGGGSGNPWKQPNGADLSPSTPLTLQQRLDGTRTAAELAEKAEAAVRAAELAADIAGLDFPDDDPAASRGGGPRAAAPGAAADGGGDPCPALDTVIRHGCAPDRFAGEPFTTDGRQLPADPDDVAELRRLRGERRRPAPPLAWLAGRYGSAGRDRLGHDVALHGDGSCELRWWADPADGEWATGLLTGIWAPTPDGAEVRVRAMEWLYKWAIADGPVREAKWAAGCGVADVRFAVGTAPGGAASLSADYAPPRGGRDVAQWRVAAGVRSMPPG